MIFQDLLDTIQFNSFGFNQVANYCVESLNELKEKKKKTEQEKEMQCRYYSSYLSFKGLKDLSLNQYHPFAIPVGQIVEFVCANIDADDIAYLFNMQMPFDKIFIDFNGTLYEHGEKIKGLLLNREGDRFFIFAITDKFYSYFIENIPHITKDCSEKTLWWNKSTIFMELDTCMPLTFLHKSNTEAYHKSKIWLTDYIEEKQGKFSKEEQEVSEVLRKIVVGFCLYVNSINVEVIKAENKQTKKRKKQNKPIPEPYYFCRLETKEVHVSDSQGQGTSHGYQYDVRGHFKHFKQGKMKGKVLWCPSHRRGLKNKVYRPKTYNLV